jgi:hypothetical protein
MLPTDRSQVLQGGLASRGDWLDVVEFQIFFGLDWMAIDKATHSVPSNEDGDFFGRKVGSV